MSQQPNIQNSNRGGVKTDEGKAISKYNAQKHSILRDTLTDYEKVDVGQIYDELMEDFKPNGRMEELLIEVLVSNIVRLQRIARAESEIIKEALSPKVMGIDLRDHEYVPRLPLRIIEGLSLYSRYQTATENRIYRGLGVLRHLKNHE